MRGKKKLIMREQVDITANTSHRSAVSQGLLKWTQRGFCSVTKIMIVIYPQAETLCIDVSTFIRRGKRDRNRPVHKQPICQSICRSHSSS